MGQGPGERERGLLRALHKGIKKWTMSNHCEISENWGIKLLEREKKVMKMNRMRTSLDFSPEPQMLDDETMLSKF